MLEHKLCGDCKLWFIPQIFYNKTGMGDKAYWSAHLVAILEGLCQYKYSTKVYSTVSLSRPAISLPLSYAQQLQILFILVQQLLCLFVLFCPIIWTNILFNTMRFNFIYLIFIQCNIVIYVGQIVTSRPYIFI